MASVEAGSPLEILCRTEDAVRSTTRPDYEALSDADERRRIVSRQKSARAKWLRFMQERGMLRACVDVPKSTTDGDVRRVRLQLQNNTKILDVGDDERVAILEEAWDSALDSLVRDPPDADAKPEAVAAYVAAAVCDAVVRVWPRKHRDVLVVSEVDVALAHKRTAETTRGRRRKSFSEELVQRLPSDLVVAANALLSSTKHMGEYRAARAAKTKASRAARAACAEALASSVDRGHVTLPAVVSVSVPGPDAGGPTEDAATRHTFVVRETLRAKPTAGRRESLKERARRVGDVVRALCLRMFRRRGERTSGGGTVGRAAGAAHLVDPVNLVRSVRESSAARGEFLRLAGEVLEPPVAALGRDFSVRRVKGHRRAEVPQRVRVVGRPPPARVPYGGAWTTR